MTNFLSGARCANSTPPSDKINPSIATVLRLQCLFMMFFPRQHPWTLDTFPCQILQLRFRFASARGRLPLALDENLGWVAARKFFASWLRAYAVLLMTGRVPLMQPRLATLPQALLRVSYFGRNANGGISIGFLGFHFR